MSDRDGGKPQTFTILYKQVGADEFIVYASNISDAGSEQTNRYIVTGLQGGLQYVFKIQASNELGNETFTSELTAKITKGLFK